MANQNLPQSNIGVGVKKHIGILFPVRSGGGVFQFTLSVANGLLAYAPDKFQYSIVYYEGEPKPVISGKAEYIALPRRRHNPLRKAIHFLGLVTGLDSLVIKELDKALQHRNIDLLVISTPFSFDVPFKIPYLACLPDYMHKYYPRWPEYTWATKTTRDIIYPYYARHSLLTVADSVQGADDIHTFTRVPVTKIRTIYYVAPSYTYENKDMTQEKAAKLLGRYRLPEKFIYYPAQFWPQKYHDRLLKALHKIKQEHGVEIPLVMVGSNKGNHARYFKQVMDLAEGLGIRNLITHPGYVEDIETVALYKKAVALVSPAFQGPTTLPPLEAMVLGTPVVTANIFEVPKQVGDAALLFNPENIDDIAEKVYKVWTNENLRKEMVKKGYAQTKDLTLENYGEKWAEVIEEALHYGSR
ncbi:MAG: glycosyltransferase family 1 protein [Candidatus Colwellbacteria bacterium]|nr:glycosyltransferase family 1 protein [Candidatus Colwellbacteria bacterium]